MAYRVTPDRLAAARRKREQIVSAAREIVLRRGFEAASVKRIAAAAGISTGSVYSYVVSLDTLHVEVFHQLATPELVLVRAAAGAADPEPAPRIRAIVGTFASRALANPALSYTLLLEPAGELVAQARLTLREEYHSLLRDIIDDGVARHELPRQDAALSGAALVGAIAESLYGPLSATRDPSADRAEIVAHIEQLCLRAVGVAAASP